MNVYRWDKPESIFKQWEPISNKPMYLSEAGADSFMKITKDGYGQGENQRAQADANGKILDQVFDNTKICSGVTLFSFTDGWWKAGNPNIHEEYWGIVDIDRNKKKTFKIVKQKYKKTKSN